LGNVLATVSDRKLQLTTDEETVSGYTADVWGVNDYYAFGMLMPGRNQQRSGYRFGFQSQESDPEIYGTGNAVSYKYRVEDARLGRFLSVDPLSAEYPWNSPYAFSENSTMAFVELEGLERYFSADGKTLGNVGSSCEIRVLPDDGLWNGYKASLKSGESGVRVTEEDLKKYSSIAYEVSDLDRLAVDWGKNAKSLPNAHEWEYAMMIYYNTFYDEDGEAFIALMPGTTITEKNRQTVLAEKSMLKIGSLELAGYEYNQSTGFYNSFTKLGWKKYAKVHNHPAGTVGEAVMNGGPRNFSFQDISMATEDNIFIFVRPFSYDFIKKYDPGIYKKETKKPFKKAWQYSPIDFDIDAIDKAIKEIPFTND
ncbi:MAG: hypothetical protein R3C61_25430, partial [Bacteroidia bacterium]